MGDHTAFFYGTPLSPLFPSTPQLTPPSQEPSYAPPPPSPLILSPSTTHPHPQMALPVLHRVIHGTPTPTPFLLSLLTTQPALLPAHRRHKVLHCDYPAIVPFAGASVRGTLVSGLTDGDLWRLDLFEGSEYKRVKVAVWVGGGKAEGDGDGKEVRAETYVWVGGEEGLEDEEWDFETFRREKMGRWVGGRGEGEFAGELVAGGWRLWGAFVCCFPVRTVEWNGRVGGGGGGDWGFG